MPNFCSNCGNELTEGISFCPNCGAEVLTSTSKKHEEMNKSIKEVNTIVNDKKNSNGKSLSSYVEKFKDLSLFKKVCCCAGVLLILFILTVIMSGISTQSDIAYMENLNLNMSEGLVKDENTTGGIAYEDSEGNRILIKPVSSSDKNDIYDNENYTKYNDTIYLYDSFVDHHDYDYNYNGEKHEANMLDMYFIAYGEYLDVDGRTYLVESSTDTYNPDKEQSLKYLKYFNEHNGFEPINLY